MVGGQVDDILSERKRPTLGKVRSIHSRKTGQLLMASVVLPGLLKGAPMDRQADLMDFASTVKKLGKAAGSDKARGKMTYPSAIGLDRSKKEIARLTAGALGVLRAFGKRGEALAALAKHMASRTN
jgi:geranylgeranyl diphosphate synthase type II